MGAGVAPAAVVTWQPVSTIAGDSDVNNTGTLVASYTFCLTYAGTINGVGFTVSLNNYVMASSWTLAGSGGNTLASSGPSAGQDLQIVDGVGSPSDPYQSLDFNYEVLLFSGVYPGNTSQMTFMLSGLTTDQDYLVEFWVNDSRLTGSTEFRSQTITSGSATSGVMDFNSTNSEGGLGQFVIGTFTADAASQAFVIDGIAAPETVAVAQLNAIQVRAIPEPGSLALLVVGGVAVLTLAKRFRLRA